MFCLVFILEIGQILWIGHELMARGGRQDGGEIGEVCLSTQGMSLTKKF